MFMGGFTLIENTLLCDQADFLYAAAAKRLYTLAFYAAGNENMATEITINAFVSSFYRIDDRSNVDLFLLLGMREIYRQGIKERIRSFWSLYLPKSNSSYMINGKTSPLINALSNLSYSKRFVLLLSCWQQLSVCQIAQIMRLPRFVIHRILYAAIKRVAKEIN